MGLLCPGVPVEGMCALGEVGVAFLHGLTGPLCPRAPTGAAQTTTWARKTCGKLQPDYFEAWQGLKSHFDPTKKDV